MPAVSDGVNFSLASTWSKPIQFGLPNPISVAFGGVFRHENYEIVAGRDRVVDQRGAPVPGQREYAGRPGPGRLIGLLRVLSH